MKICMFVWNTFERDARVTREATALVEEGHSVTVVCIHDWKRTRRKEVKRGVRVRRVSRLPLGLGPVMFPYIAIRKRQDVLYAKLIRERSTPFSSALQFLFIKVPNKLLHVALKVFYKGYRFLTKLPGETFRKTVINARLAVRGLLERADLYQAHDLNAFLPPALCARLRRTPLIYDTHEIAVDRTLLKRKRWWEWLERKLIYGADAVMTTTATRAAFLGDRYGIPIPVVLRNVSELREVPGEDTIRKALALPPGEKVLLYQGGIQVGRGLEQILEALPLIRSGTLVLIGNGKLKPELERRVAEGGLGGRVRFLPAVPLEALPPYTASADLGFQVLQNVCFNHYSTISNKIFEYMMAGVPVVASDFPEIRKILTEYPFGLLVDPHEPEEIARAANDILTNERKVREMKDKARTAARELNWENEKGIYTSLVARLLERKGLPMRAGDGA